MAAVTTICLGFLLVCAVHLSLTGGVTAATSQWANDRVQDHLAYREAGDFLTVQQNIMNRPIRKLDVITQQMASLATSLEDLDSDLRRALDSTACTGFRDNICQAMELLKYLETQNGYLNSPASPGKRSADAVTLAKYQRMLNDVRQKQREVQRLHDLVSSAGRVMERQKKWFSCHLNLGFTCQTQEYADIADYYDFLNSAESPGKKRSALARHSP